MSTLPSFLFTLGVALLGLPLAWLVNWLADRLVGPDEGKPSASDTPDPAPGTASAPLTYPDSAPVALDLSHFPRAIRYRPWVVAVLLPVLNGVVGLGYGPEWRVVPGLFYVSLFVLITVVDLEHRIIPNEVVLFGGLIALAFSFVPPHPVPYFFAFVGGAAGLIIFSVVYLIGVLALTRDALAQSASPVGLGDLKLAALIGLITGFPAVMGAIFVGAFIAGVFMIGLLVFGRVGRRTFVPYGPFLVLGAAWTYFFALRGYLS